ncbi:30S ribosome-binding factor RbfA [Helicobacter jaachi]|uniref:30S ribosome-binding factor RbfA n=1 Tax=Helicobacter jaachi TaxID=1677920 RepID=A0A4V6I2U8_9HELI|nr:30S ribosome-binding factor RbfA [Helicobacter jaachi]TLD97452.1 30S ribosome-binding factor RbfA [Helicobacter jaachi]
MNIKQQRLESLLQEVLSQALAELADSHINHLTITGVKASSKQSAEVFIEGTDIPPQERKIILERLKKAQNILKDYVLSATEWFRAPELSFSFDDSLQNANRLEHIFAQLANEQKNQTKK